MGRLIDADILKQCYTGSNGMDDKASYESIRRMIDNQPTVYDTEKISQDLTEVIDALEVYTAGRLNTSKVNVTVLQLQRCINKLKAIIH